MPQLQHLTRSAGADAIWAAIDADGGVIVDDFLSSDVLGALRSDFAPAISDHHAGAASGNDFWKNFHGSVTKRITGLADMSPASGDLLGDPLYKGMADHYLGADNYYLNTGQLICIGPGETPQLLDRDELNWPHAAGRDGELTITAILVKVIAKALESFPIFNASVDAANKTIIYKEYIHIGVAVDTEKGLVVPKIENANQKNIFCSG